MRRPFRPLLSPCYIWLISWLLENLIDGPRSVAADVLLVQCFAKREQNPKPSHMSYKEMQRMEAGGFIWVRQRAPPKSSSYRPVSSLKCCHFSVLHCHFLKGTHLTSPKRLWNDASMGPLTYDSIHITIYLISLQGSMKFFSF